MTSRFHTSARAALLTVLVGGSALLAPRSAGAQSITAEQAFLNRVTAPRGTADAFTQGSAAPLTIEQGFVDGERALLNRSPAADGQPKRQNQAVASGLSSPSPVDGVKALLNRSAL